MTKSFFRSWAGLFFLCFALSAFSFSSAIAQTQAAATGQEKPMAEPHAPAHAPSPVAALPVEKLHINTKSDEPTFWESVIGFFFPTLRKVQADPTSTLQAPFADPQPAGPLPAGAKPFVAELPVNAIPLEQPHRRNLEISQWLMETLSGSTTYVNANYKPDLEKIQGSFTVEGRQQLTDFLTHIGAIKALDSGQYTVRGFVREVPVTLNEGPVGGYYRWLYEAPITITYLPRDTSTYKNAKPVNQYFLVTVQVGRTATETNEIGVLVENWSFKVQKSAEKSKSIGR
jgi:hypothetical protein